MKKTVIISLLVAVAILSSWYFVLARPMQARINGLRDEVTAQQKTVTTFRECLSTLNIQMERYVELSSIQMASEQPFSGATQVGMLYHLLDSLCSGREYHLEEITPSLSEVLQFLRDWENSKTTVFVPINIKIQGQYEDLAYLMETLEENQYFDHLISFRMTGNLGQYPNCLMELSFAAGLDNRREILGLD